MDNPFVLLGIFIFISFVYLDISLNRWKKEHDEKLNDIKITLEELQSDFNEKFGDTEENFDEI